MKVYCKNCRWSKHFDYGAEDFWRCKLRIKRFKDCIGDKRTDMSNAYCEKINQDFACLNYECNWLKFLGIRR